MFHSTRCNCPVTYFDPVDYEGLLCLAQVDIGHNLNGVIDFEVWSPCFEYGF